MSTRGFVYEFGQWGPAYWRVAHSITWLYPDNNPSPQQKQHIRLFFQLLPDLLPCPLCGNHFRETTASVHPLTEEVLGGRKTLTQWLIDVHNEVNRRLDKPTVTYAEAEAYYLRDCGSRPARPSTAGREVGLIVAALVLFGIGGLAGFLAGRQPTKQTSLPMA
jgi:hypothetical protein